MSKDNPDNNLRIIKRALLSVSDKTGIVEFAKELEKLGVEIISTGGTARTLLANNIKVREVADVTGFPEMMDGRVKTLHPKVHGALLGLRDNAEHVAAMTEHDITPIDLLIVNLYPFEETIADEGVQFAQAIEQIDIGGPAMIRSAAKNWQSVAVVVEPGLYEIVLDELKVNNGSLSQNLRQMLGTLAFVRTSTYDAAIADYLTQQFDPNSLAPDVMMTAMNATMKFAPFDDDEDDSENFETTDDFDDLAKNNGLLALEGDDVDEDDDDENFPKIDDIELDKLQTLRYGENPHQRAALYETELEGGIAQAELLGGKEMSYNNYIDADAAWNLVSSFDETACAIIKHTNPSGVGTGANLEEAYRRALATDPLSAFGGIVAFNKTVDAQTAQSVTEIFTEVVLAPDFDDSALEILRAKKNLRILRVEPLEKYEDEIEIEYRQISGGFLSQIKDNHVLTPENLRVVTKRQPTEREIKAMLFAWKVCKHVKSNAIVYANEYQTVGVGAGQMSRIDSVKLGAMRAVLEVKNTVLASDAFFPFRDGIDEAAKTGITAIIQPGGSIKDDETIKAADENGLAMVFTDIRHFKH
ncbi:MAG: bifunctional phosphoribosylaminoimidazolecarboxamide formyltransferase/IMP cyclohydrolase [Pyrinomonadaceae bacterium]|nr:bifunctional phosphoribosylaminoimidazolecarboxamide formyltransferase/IMP cyclohydrolase [Pyrinomonadaceae bacterium]